MDPRTLAPLDHATLWNMRDKTSDPRLQALLAPYEHRAFAREAVRDNPLMALSLLVATPLYTAGKAAGLLGARSPASWEEMKQGLLGIGEGLLKR